MVTVATNHETEADRQKRESARRHHELWHEYCDLIYRHDVVRKALDAAIRDEWQGVHAYRAIVRRHFSAYADQAARRDALRHWRILRRLLDVRKALRRVERGQARRQKAREEQSG